MRVTLHWYKRGYRMLSARSPRHISWHVRIQWFYQGHVIERQQAFTGYIGRVAPRIAWNQAINSYIDALVLYTRRGS